MLAENMYKEGKDRAGNNVGVKSYLVDSQAWNHICSNIFKVGTGSSDDFKRYNIYDMAGNMWEWTTSHNINNDELYVVPRGGSFNINGTTNSVVRAVGHSALTYYCLTVRFRVVLYIQYN